MATVAWATCNMHGTGTGTDRYRDRYRPTGTGTGTGTGTVSVGGRCRYVLSTTTLSIVPGVTHTLDGGSDVDVREAAA